MEQHKTSDDHKTSVDVLDLEHIGTKSEPVPTTAFGYQYAVTGAATLLMLSCGMALGWSSPSVPKLLNDPDSPIHVTPDEGSWIASLMELGMSVSAIPSVILMDRIGRVRSLTVGALPIIIAWILIGTGDTVAYLYVARIFCGLSLGLGYCVLPMYLGEIASPEIRGRLSIAFTLLSKIGLLFVYSVGPFVPVRTLAYICLVPPVVFVISSFWLPETCYFLLSQGNHARASANLARLRGHSNIATELQRMDEAIRKSKENSNIAHDLFSKPHNRRSLLIIVLLSCIQIMCGSQAILAYSQIIFDKMKTGLIAAHVAIIMASVQVVAVFTCTLIVDRVGRRPLILIAIFGTTVCNIIVTIYFVLDNLEMDLANVTWLPVLSIMAFIVCYNLGLPTVNVAVLGEIFPSNLKGVASLVYTVTTALLAFGINKLFQVVSDGLGSEYAFGAFAVCGIVFFPFIWYLLPETKGRSLEAIQEEFQARAARKTHSKE